MSDVDDLIGYTSAHVLVRSSPSELLSLAKSRALDDSIFADYPPFFWESEISSDRLDAYYTEMDASSTLPNFAADAAEGRAVLIGHDNRATPTGYSLTGTLEHTGEVARVRSHAYALSDPATAPTLNRLRAGIVRDVSVGFPYKGAKCLCSICGLDMWRDWNCMHIPGFEYEMSAAGSSGSNGAKVMVLCKGKIVDAHLSEYSLVFDGATPGAAVLQAQKAAEAGRLSTSQARLIEQRYRINLPGKRLVTQGATMAGENGNGHAPDERALQAILERAGVPSDKTGLDRIRWLADEVQRLTPLAADGTAYRTDLVAQGVAEAVRAFGAENGEKKRAMLEKAELGDIKELTSSWRDIGDSKLKGGRLSTDEPNEETPATWRKVNAARLHG
jgi:hypothetical protein